MPQPLKYSTPYLHAFSSALEKGWLVHGGDRHGARAANLFYIPHLLPALLDHPLPASILQSLGQGLVI